MRVEKWTVQEMEEIITSIYKQAINYYINKYGDIFVKLER